MTPMPDAQQLVEHFNRWAPDYDGSALQAVFYEPLQDEALVMARRAVARPQRILDVGCGTARLLDKAQATLPEAEMVGVDVADRMLVQARDRAGRPRPIRLVQADVMNLPFPPETFDLAFSTASCHHWADRFGAFTEIRRVLRPGGVFVLAHLLGVPGHDQRPMPARRHLGRRGGNQEADQVVAELRESGLAPLETALRCACSVMPRTVAVSARRNG